MRSPPNVVPNARFNSNTTDNRNKNVYKDGGLSVTRVDERTVHCPDEIAEGCRPNHLVYIPLATDDDKRPPPTGGLSRRLVSAFESPAGTSNRRQDERVARERANGMRIKEMKSTTSETNGMLRVVRSNIFVVVLGGCI